MKKRVAYSFIGCLSIILSGCLGLGNGEGIQSKVKAGYRLYETSEVRMEVPDAWEEVSALKYKSGEHTIASFRSNVRNNQFTPNVVLINNTLSGEVASIDYGRALYKKVSDQLLAVREKEASTRKILIGGIETETLLTDIEGRESADSDQKRYMHISGVKGREAYILIAAARANEDQGVVEVLRMMVESFEIK